LIFIYSSTIKSVFSLRIYLVRHQPMKLLLQIAVIFMFLSGTASAQFVDSDATETPKGNSGGVADQADNTTDTFEGVTIQVQRVVAIPSNDHALRVLLRVIESDDTGRRIAFVSPQGTLVDELGNIYGLVSSTGVNICERSRDWDLDFKGCPYYSSGIPVKMTTSQPIQVSATFEPLGDDFSAELAGVAETAALQLRFGLYSNNLEEITFADAVINAVALPQ